MALVLCLLAVVIGGDPPLPEWARDADGFPQPSFLLQASPTGLRKDAPDQRVGARFRLWQADLEGMVRADDQMVPGDEIQVDQVLGIEQGENLNNAGLWVNLGKTIRLVADYWWGTFEGDEVLGTNVTFAGTVFSMGDRAMTELEWRNLTGLLEVGFRFPLGGLAELRAGPRVGVKYLRIRGEITTPGDTDSAAVRGPAPVVGASAELYFGPYASLEIEGNGLKVSLFDLEGTIYDVTAVVRAGYGGAFVGAGYRWFGLDLEGDDVGVEHAEVDLTIRGFFVEAGFRF
jgi:hypothetical protein